MKDGELVAWILLKELSRRKSFAVYYLLKMFTNPHVLFKDICSRLHFNHTVDDQFTVGSQEVSPFVQSFNLYCFIILLTI